MTRCFAFNTPHHKNEQAGKILEINLQVQHFGATETAESWKPVASSRCQRGQELHFYIGGEWKLLSVKNQKI